MESDLRILTLARAHVGTRKGDVIKFMLSQDHPVTWREIHNATGLEEKALNAVLRELFASKEIRKVDSKYEITQKLQTDFEESFNTRKVELISWINQWKKVRKLDFSLEHEHFFLEGRHLDDFSKELISHAKSEVVVVNPFIQDCDLSNTLRDVKKRGIDVKVLTRPPKDDQPHYLRRKQEYHSKLIHDGISLIFQERVHAKFIVVDRAIAIVSSMNFYADSSAGVSWEAGLISTDAKVIESIVTASFSRIG